MDDNEEVQLHPAARVFRTEVLGGIEQENRRLAKDVERLEPLLDYIQTIELAATISEGRIEAVPDANGILSVTPSASERKVICATRLSEGSVEVHGEDGKLIIPVTTTDRVLLTNLGHAGGIGIRMASQVLGWFPSTFNQNLSMNLAGSVIVDMDEENDSAHLTIFISDTVSIQGELGNLSNEDVVQFRESPGNRMSMYLMGFTGMMGGQVGIPTFAPTSIAIKLTPQLSNTLSLIESAASPPKGLESECLSDELRHLTMAAIGTERDREMLNENRRLKLFKDALLDIRDKILRVDISHPGGTMSCSLEEGTLMKDAEGNHTIWEVVIWEKEDSAMPVASVRDSAFFLSGVQLNNGDLLYNVREGGGLVVHAENQPLLGLQIPYTFSVSVIGAFDWEGLSGDEINGMAPTFRSDIISSISRFRDRPSFPPTFQLKLSEVRFSLKSVARMLQMAGLGDKLVRCDGIEGHAED